LLLSLAVSDVGVGLLVQPFYTSVLVKWMLENNPGCNTFTASCIITSLYSPVWFLGVLALLSVNSFLAIHLHLRYKQFVTHKRVVSVVISIWVLDAFLPFLMLSVPLDIYSRIMYSNYRGFRCYSYNDSLYEEIFTRRTTQESDSGPASTTSSVDWRRRFFSSLSKSVVSKLHVYQVVSVC